MNSLSNPGVSSYYGVQALRALGALLVVVFHATNAVRDKIDANAWQFNAGMSGVDLFFAISGFIMVVTTHTHWHKPGQALRFLKRRLIRIFPLYWVATTLKLALVLVVPALAANTVLAPWHTTASYLLIPAWNANHEAFPLLVPGWTLSFELLFYLMFALALAAQKSPILWLSYWFIAFSILSLAFAPFAYAPLTLLDTRLLEFCLGMGVGWMAIHARSLPKKVAIFAALLGLGLMIGNMLSLPPLDRYPIVMWGLPAALLLWATISLESYVTAWKAAWIQALGAASYAIYLFHPFVVSALGIVISKLALGTLVSLLAIVPLALIFSSLAGVALHRWLEAPMLQYLRRSMKV